MPVIPDSHMQSEARVSRLVSDLLGDLNDRIEAAKRTQDPLTDLEVSVALHKLHGHWLTVCIRSERRRSGA